MGTPPGLTPIQKPTPPTPPVPSAPPLVASLPQAASTVPTDTALLHQLTAMGTAEARAFIDAYRAFGKRDLFEARLAAAVTAAPSPIGLRPFLIHLARLGAEAFVLDVTVATDKALQVGFIDHPAHLSQGQIPQREQFLHFAVRRLLELSSSSLMSDVRREQMDKTIILFTFIQSELDRDGEFLTIATDAVLVEYRQLLFKVMETHYQALMDDLLASGLPFRDAVKSLSDHFRATTKTDLAYKRPPKVPLYRIDGKRFRDYFNPALKSDFHFQFYSHRASPVVGAGPETSFRSVLKTRRKQVIVLDDLRPGPHLIASALKLGNPPSRPGIYLRPEEREFSAAQPEPPKLHDNASWQSWVRRMWDTAELGKPALGLEGLPGKLEDICRFVSDYFHAFTVHVPYDLAEGCKETNYLTRTYPRAINGCLAHDCWVYATRWIYILGQLFAPHSIPYEISKPRIFIIEMPSHGGVMIRSRLLVGGDVLIAINNQDAVVKEIHANLDDSKAAEDVVAGMYPGLKTPIMKREITANPSNSTAVWNQLCKISEGKLRLPYDDPSEPFLNYLRFNAQSAALETELAGEVGERWRAMTQKLDAVKQPGKLRPAVKQELKAYHEAIEPLFRAAVDKFSEQVMPLAEIIERDVEAHLSQIPKGAVVVTTDQQLTPWQMSILQYRVELTKAEQSLDLSNIDPEDFFHEDNFPTDVQ